MGILAPDMKAIVKRQKLGFIATVCRRKVPQRMG